MWARVAADLAALTLSSGPRRQPVQRPSRESILGACVEAQELLIRPRPAAWFCVTRKSALPPACSRARGLQGPRCPDPLGLGSKFPPVSRAAHLRFEVKFNQHLGFGGTLGEKWRAEHQVGQSGLPHPYKMKRLVPAESPAFAHSVVGASGSLIYSLFTRTPGLGPNNTRLLAVQKHDFRASHSTGRQCSVGEPSEGFPEAAACASPCPQCRAGRLVGVDVSPGDTLQ